MAAQKLGIIVIHGVGCGDSDVPDVPGQPTFSAGMARRVLRKLGGRADQVVWKEVCWSDILQPRQRAYLDMIRSKTGDDKTRNFMLSALSDAAAYRKTSDGSAAIYERIHSRVELAFRGLEAEIGADGPVLVLAHSLGAHIMSNYIYDLQRFSLRSGDQRFASPIQNARTIAGFMSFGCNIPVFLFGYRRAEVIPILYPGHDLQPSQQISPWWQNFYDKRDILAYPMGPSAPCYAAMVADRDLRDIPVNLGRQTQEHWDPLSHGSYWDDPEMIAPVVHYINKFFDAAVSPSV